VVPLPMGLASRVFEGREAIRHGLTHTGATAWQSVPYAVCLSTLVAYSAWSWLLSHHPASTVTPFTLLVPVFGMATSAFYLGEALPGWKRQAAGLVIAGLRALCLRPAPHRRCAPATPRLSPAPPVPAGLRAAPGISGRHLGLEAAS